ncbi:hypothetical protein GCM10010238_58540 [Streptomyces griseoviridis]|uniref:Uncharacterized protein n=2 Tax=Streptomyces TaxID=1883 RepID=A0A918LKA3_STRGD|nr:hypothetical protein GCM10010238_58540 [Streptomyces niveoruber]
MDNGTAVAGNGDGPLVGREPSAEDRTSPTKEKLMSKPERTGNSPDPEPLPSSRTRWAKRARRLRNEAGLHLLRGVATAVGGAIVAYGGLWIQSR